MQKFIQKSLFAALVAASMFAACGKKDCPAPTNLRQIFPASASINSISLKWAETEGPFRVEIYDQNARQTVFVDTVSRSPMTVDLPNLNGIFEARVSRVCEGEGQQAVLLMRPSYFLTVVQQPYLAADSLDLCPEIVGTTQNSGLVFPADSFFRWSREPEVIQISGGNATSYQHFMTFKRTGDEQPAQPTSSGVFCFGENVPTFFCNGQPASLGVSEAPVCGPNSFEISGFRVEMNSFGFRFIPKGTTDRIFFVRRK